MPKRRKRTRPAPAAPQPFAQWQKAGIAWRDIAHSAVGSPFLADLVGGAVTFLGVLLERELRAKAEAAARARTAPPAADATPRPSERVPDVGSPSVGNTESPASENTVEEPPPPPPAPLPIDPRAAEAARALGICVDASEDEIRAALRGALSSSRLHPDHGGDGEEAKTLIAAKNLLVERARARR
jgi:hypothetical protein